MVRLSEITVPSGDTFAGLDVNHGSLDQKVPALLSKELQYQLGLVMSGPGMGRGRITLKPLGEARAWVCMNVGTCFNQRNWDAFHFRRARLDDCALLKFLLLECHVAACFFETPSIAYLRVSTFVLLRAPSFLQWRNWLPGWDFQAMELWPMVWYQSRWLRTARRKWCMVASWEHIVVNTYVKICKRFEECVSLI